MLEDFEDSLDKSDVRHFYWGFIDDLSRDQLRDGVIMVQPVSETAEQATTGIQDRNTYNLQIILAKSVEGREYVNASQETGQRFLQRIMSNCDDSGGLESDTVKYIVRTNMLDYSGRQPTIEINYDDDRYEDSSIPTATMSVVCESIKKQTIS
jgi:hypothetical protein